MVIWTVANQKGGVGKTTSTIALGGLLAERNNRVLLIDLDPHASLTYYFNIDSEELQQSAYDLLLEGPEVSYEKITAAIQQTSFENIDVLPATMALATLDRKLGGRSGMGLVLRKALRKLRMDYDYVLIDVPPVLGVLMVNALAACSQVIVPVQTETLALKGLDRMLQTLELVKNSLRQNHLVTVVPTMYDKRTRASLDAYQKLIKKHGSKVWAGMIPVDTKFRDASAEHTPPSLHAPKARGVLAYTQLLQHLLSKTNS
ncbi:ParA family protein [Aliidiomarina quisquiliarum]|uniref:ParA family protein n=1 Tax=Aliidiomarina quisquiliarum TaxID=2938947 RepID=UPI00208E4E08|nr:ParA family protein [Aliidiomarina quisquiliarum]MCO4321683.1 ParA family protein [Aliidiomarina quisquiliarum]